MDSPSLSVIIASSGRPTLARAMESAREQVRDGDEILVSVNTDCPWGHAARNQLMTASRGAYLLFMDDDDMYAPGALDAVRSALAADTHEDAVYHMHIFRMRYPNGSELWTQPVVRCGNVSTQMVCVPSIAPSLAGCRWGDRYEGDFDFISACAQRLDVRWHEDVIALVRP